MAFFRSIGVTLEMIKWEHSIFALPFALTGAMLAAGGADFLGHCMHGDGAVSSDGLQPLGGCLD